MLKDIVIKNRSYRGYDPSVKVSMEQLKSLINLTRYTASSMNQQVLRFHAACEEKEVSDILALTKWAAALPNLKLPFPGKEPTAFIVIYQDTAVNANLNTFRPDIGIAAQTMLLGAVEMGLGGCMIGNFPKEGMKQLIGLAENLEPVLVVAIGKPDEEIVLTDADEATGTKYYRDETGNIHYVPKRKLEDIIV